MSGIKGTSSILFDPEDVKTNIHDDILPDLLTDNVFLLDSYHNELFFEGPTLEDCLSGTQQQAWKSKDRTKTSLAILIMCLNIGTDPPDIVKPNPYAKRQCWIEPTQPASKSLEAIGKALQSQYEKLHSKMKCGQCLDPSFEDVKTMIGNLRSTARNDRMLFHYNGHGVPKPTKKAGEIWLYAKHYTHYVPLTIQEVKSLIKGPAVYVFDCSAAGVLIPYLVDSSSNTPEGWNVVLAACKGDENLPLNPNFPADLFTSCLTTPIPIAIRWLILQNPHSLGDISLELSESIPGKESDRKTPRGELYWIFTAITDTIAWSTLQAPFFQKIFRQDLLLATLFRNFLFARRVMKTYQCTPQSYPLLPDTSNHPLWKTWDLTAESFILYVNSMLNGSMMVDPRNNIVIQSPNLSFFVEQLQSFENWLEFGGRTNEVPMHLPIILQVLLSQSYRLRALVLLRRYLSLGSSAVYATLIVGMYPYILKLLQSGSSDVQQVLVGIWAYIIGYDPSVRSDIENDRLHVFFIRYLNNNETPLSHKSLVAFSLSEICNGSIASQDACFQFDLHSHLCRMFGDISVVSFPPLLKWVCLCLAKLCEGRPVTKYQSLLTITLLQNFEYFERVLQVGDPMVRCCALYLLGELFGGSDITGPFAPRSIQSKLNPQMSDVELMLAIKMLEYSCVDGCVAVRREAMIALSKFVVVPIHFAAFRVIAKVSEEWSKQQASSKNSVQVSSSAPANASNPLLSPSISRPSTPSPAAAASMDPKLAEKTLPWILSGEAINSLVEMLTAFLEHNGMAAENYPQPDENNNRFVAQNMAANYVQIWLSLLEIEGKDPHFAVATAASTIIRKIYESNHEDSFFDGSNNKVTEQWIKGQVKIDHSTKEINFSNEPKLTSHIYNWMKKLFITPTSTYDSANDALSFDGNLRIYREGKVRDMLNQVHRLQETYRCFDDSIDDKILDKKTKEEQQQQRSTMISNMPQSLTKFDQKCVISSEGSKLVSNIAFHPFQDILATSDGQCARIWSIQSSSKLMEIRNTHNHLGSMTLTSRYAGTSMIDSSSSTSRITTMKWINGGYESLLMIGSNNGVVNVWKDISDLDSISASSHTGLSHSSSNSSLASLSGNVASTSSTSNSSNIHSSLYSSTANTTLNLATSFLALPDVPSTDKGSGLISSWNQESGILAVGGNSPSIRLWDLSREQCVRIFSTGLDTCTSAIASKPLSSSFFTSSEYKLKPPANFQGHGDSGYVPSSWLFAGFGDGTVAIFDDRVSSNGGKTQSARIDPGVWVVDAYMRHDIPQVISAHFNGKVRFWDVRKLRVYKTLEVFKQSLTALAVHPCLPVMATGTPSQSIKVFTTGGDQLGSDIKYHDGFLGQRISPVACLAFHPYKMMLAAGANDTIVSVYSPSDVWNYENKAP